MNLKIREFKLSLVAYINETDIPEEIKRMVLKEIYEDIEKAADEMVVQEFNEREKGKYEQSI